MRTTSWVLLTIVGTLTFLASLISTNLAYRGDYPVGGVNISEVAGDRTPVLEGLRGIRGTSAAYAGAYAALFLAIVLGPYRRGDVWAWWALLAAIAVLAGIVTLRLAFLQSRLGVGAALLPTGLTLLALLFDVKRVSGGPARAS